MEIRDKGCLWGWRGWSGKVTSTYTCCRQPCSAHAADWAHHSLPPCPPLLLPCILLIVLHKHRLRVWAPVGINLGLVLGYNSHLPLLPRGNPACPSPIHWSPSMDPEDHYFCQDFLAPVKIREEKWRRPSKSSYMEAELLQEGKKRNVKAKIY